MQAIAHKPDVVTVVYVKAAPGRRILSRSQAEHPRRVPLADDGVAGLEECRGIDQGIKIDRRPQPRRSRALAVGIGAIGVMNTMVMSVFERTREIGILRAVGWSRSRILQMIVGESLFLCLIAAVVGSDSGCWRRAP